MQKLLALIMALVSLMLPFTAYAALNFDSTNSAGLDFGKPAALALTKSMTITAWIYFRTYGVNNSGRIFTYNDSGSGGYLLLLQNAAGAVNTFQFSIQAGTAMNANQRVLATSTWEFIAVSYNSGGTQANFYVNGQAAGVGNSIANPTASGADGVIGNSFDHLRGFDGYISNVQVYNRALSQQEVQQQMWSFFPRYNGLVAWWPLIQGYGNGMQPDWGPNRIYATSTKSEAGIINTGSREYPGRLSW